MTRKNNFRVNLKPTYYKNGWKSFECSTGQVDTGVTGVVGSSFGTAPTTLTPVLWTKTVIDAAKASTRFAETALQEVVPEGNSQIVVPKRTHYLGTGDFEGGSAEPTTEISKTEIGTLDGVDLYPTDETYLVGVTYSAMRQNNVNLVKHCREELANFYSKVADDYVRVNTMGDSNSTEADVTAAPTAMTDSQRGAQLVFGGDATNADDSLASGDILTTDLFKKMLRLLSSDTGYYWNSNSWTKSSTKKNPWEPTNGEPFVFFTTPEGREAFHNESQFVNASEYGSDQVVLNGEIGEYLGVKIINTTRCTSFSDGDYIYGDGSDDPLMNVDGHINMMAKAGKYAALAYGQKPTVKMFDYPSVAEVRLMLHMAMDGKAVHPDAIVRAAVSDE